MTRLGNWPAQAWGTGIGQRTTMDWNWLARGRRTGLASPRSGNSPSQLATMNWNWLARDQRTLRQGNGIGYLALGERELASSRSSIAIGSRATRQRHWPARAWGTALARGMAFASARSWIGIGQLATREQPQPARDQPTSRPGNGIGYLVLRGQELASQRPGNRHG